MINCNCNSTGGCLRCNSYEQEKESKSIKLLRDFSHISPQDLEEIMEWLNDFNYLNENGRQLRYNFWKTFIKNND